MVVVMNELPPLTGVTVSKYKSNPLQHNRLLFAHQLA